MAAPSAVALGLPASIVDSLCGRDPNPFSGADSSGANEPRAAALSHKFALNRSLLRALFQAGDLKIAKSLPEAAVLAAEMSDLRALISEKGYVSLGACVDKHLVLALAIACEHLVRDSGSWARQSLSCGKGQSATNLVSRLLWLSTRRRWLCAPTLEDLMLCEKKTCYRGDKSQTPV
jgi:hypothetical protein